MQKAVKTEKKQGSNQSSGLQEALRRRNEESTRFLYEDAIQHCKTHLKECHEPGCVRCKEAKVLIPHYKARMKEELESAA